MPFSLDPLESMPDGVRRIAHEQLRQSIRKLTEGTEDRDDDVHSARKSMKRMRGLVRLVRSELGGQGYALENATYRDAARRLAGLRDATVLVACLDDLVLWLGDTLAPQEYAGFRAALARRRSDAYDVADGRDRMIAEVAEALDAADKRVDDWRLRGGGWAAVADGLGRVYRRGRIEADEASWRPTVESLHQWRKRVKYLWYHTQVLAPLWPGPFAAWQLELDRLGDLLGDDHDLAVLADTARAEAATTGPETGLDECQLTALLGQISTRRHALQEEARILGLRIYAERPAALRRRLRGYWRAWREQAIQGVPAAATTVSGPPAAVAPQRIADTRCRTGEGPLWHADEGCLYWVDIPEGRLYRYDPDAGSHAEVFHGEPIGGFTVQADGSLLLFMARGAVAVWRPGQPLRHIVDEIAIERESRFNDVIADPEGRVFCGTMPSAGAGGRLYRLDTDGTLTELFDEIGCSNGMGFTPDVTHLYFIDSPTKQISRFAYDRGSGELSDREVFADTTDDDGVPDGMTVDAEGHVWCARWDGACLIRYRPDGSQERRIEFPAQKVSCPTFGGPAWDELYVTTAGGPDRDTEGDGAGALFRVRPGVRGVPEFRSRICL